MAFEALAKFVSDRKEFSSTEDRSEMQEKWALAIKAYNNYISGGYTGHTKINVPETFATTFRIAAAINTDIRQNRDIVNYVPYPKMPEYGIPSELAKERMQAVSDFYVNKSQILRPIASVILETITLGSSHVRTTWNGDKDLPVIEHRPLKNLFIDPKIIPSQKLPWEGEFVVDSSWVSFDSLMQNDKFANLSDVKSRIKGSTVSGNYLHDQITQAYDTSLKLGMSGVESRDEQSDMVQVDEYWGMVPRALLKERRRKDSYSDKDLKDYVLAQVIVAEGIVIFAQDSPYEKIPYDVFRCYPRTGFYYGIGVPEHIAPLQRVLNGLVNQRMDNVSLILNRMFWYRQGMVNPKLLVSRPGGAIPVSGDGRQSLGVIETQDVTQSSYQEQNNIISYISKSTGAEDIFFGRGAGYGQKEKTAFEVGQSIELGAGMMQEIVALMVNDGFVPMMEKWRDLILRFQTEDMTVVVGGKPTVVTPDDIKSNYELVPTVGDKMFTKAAEFQKSMMVLQLTAEMYPLIQQQGGEVDFVTLYERMYTNMGYRDAKAIIRRKNEQAETQGPPQDGTQGLLGPVPQGGGAGGVTPDIAAVIRELA